MTNIPKLVMIVGGIIFAIGFLMQFINLGKLPGDIIIKRGNSTFYFPIATSIILSIALSVILYFFGKIR